MFERTTNSLEGLAVGLRCAQQAERCLDQGLAVHIWGYEEIVKNTPLSVGVYWNTDRTDMLLEEEIPAFTASIEVANGLLPRKSNVNLFWKAATSEAVATLCVDSRAFSGVGRTPALALCAACVAYEAERRRTWAPRLAA